MGIYISILLDKDKFYEKIKDARRWELMNVLHYLLFLDDTIEGYSWNLVESNYDTMTVSMEIKNLIELKNFMLHIFDYVYEDEILEYMEKLNSDIAKDMFYFIIRDWKEKLLFFFFDRFMHEDIFIPFTMVRDDYKREVMEEKHIELDEAIEELVAKLNEKKD